MHCPQSSLQATKDAMRIYLRPTKKSDTICELREFVRVRLTMNNFNAV